MEVGESDTALRQALYMWSLDLSTKGTHVRESQIIGDDDEEIRPLRHVLGHSTNVYLLADAKQPLGKFSG